MQHRIRVAGGGARRLFSDGAVHHVARLSKGIPRLINLLCDRALLGAYAENADHVSLKIMKKAGREVFGPAQSAFPSLRFILITAVALVVFGIGLPITYYYLKIPSVERVFKQLQQLGVPGPAESKPTIELTPKVEPPAEADDRPLLSKDEQNKKKPTPPVPVEQAVSNQELKPDQQSDRKK